MTTMLYCVKCRQKTLTNDLQQVITKNSRHMLRGKCVTCGLTKTQFIKKSTTGGDLASSLSAITSNVKLPCRCVYLICICLLFFMKKDC